MTNDFQLIYRTLDSYCASYDSCAISNCFYVFKQILLFAVVVPLQSTKHRKHPIELMYEFGPTTRILLTSLVYKMDGFLAFFLERSEERNDKTFGSFRYSSGISFISTPSALPRYLMLCWIDRPLRLSHSLCTKYAYSSPFTLLVLMYANKQCRVKHQHKSLRHKYK
jgi:hypothetical protein